MSHMVCTIYCSVLPVQFGDSTLGSLSTVNPTGFWLKRIPHSRVSTILYSGFCSDDSNRTTSQ